MTIIPERIATEDLRRQLSSRLEFYRRRTKDLIDPLDDDDVHRQHNSIMSPLVWDVGHVGNFEELWLLRNLDGRQAHDLMYDEMYNPFDNPRWTRGNLPLLNRQEALEYIDEVRGDALEARPTNDVGPTGISVGNTSLGCSKLAREVPNCR